MQGCGGGGGGVRMGLPEVMGWWERHACVGQSLGVTGLPLSASACSNGHTIKLAAGRNGTFTWGAGRAGACRGMRLAGIATLGMDVRQATVPVTDWGARAPRTRDIASSLEHGHVIEWVGVWHAMPPGSI